MKRKIRVLYTIPNFDTAGSGKVLYDLAKGLDKDKFEVMIACRHDKGSFFKQVKSLGLPIFLLETTVPLKPYFNLFSRVKPFKCFLKEQSIDIVHSWHWSSDWSEPLSTRLSGAKFVYTKKAMSWGNRHWKIRSFLSNFIITVNTDMKQFFSNNKKQKLIPFGLDINYYKANINPKTQDVFKIVTVANLVEVKAIEVLIKAIKQINKPEIHLDIIGDDTNSYASFLKDLTKEYQLKHQIKFLGKQVDVRPYLRQSDLYVIPSKKEGMPMALVEAMAMQLPVLGSDISGIHYVLKDFNELLFETNNHQMLSEKILTMYHTPLEERLAIGKKLKTYCESYFSLNSFISAHETLYFKLAGKAKHIRD